MLDTDRTTVRLRSPVATEVGLDVAWSRWLTVDGPACVLRDGDRTRLRFTGPGEVVVGSALRLRPPGHCSTSPG